MLLPIARRLVTPPASEPVSLASVKSDLRIQHTLDDSLIENIWIPSAREEAEKISAHKFITQIWEFTYSRFPALAEDLDSDSRQNASVFSNQASGSFRLPIRPVQSVSISYIDTAGVRQTFGTLDDASPASIIEYSLIRDKEGPRIILNFNQQWPYTAPVENAVTILVTAGYGDDATAVPPLFKHGCNLLCGHFNENREAVVIDEMRVTSIEIPLGIRSLLANPKVG